MLVERRTPSRIATISSAGLTTAALVDGGDGSCCAGVTLNVPQKQTSNRESRREIFFMADLNSVSQGDVHWEAAGVPRDLNCLLPPADCRLAYTQTQPNCVFDGCGFCKYSERSCSI